MKKLLAILVLAGALGACSTLNNIVGVVTGTTVTPQQAYIAANAYDTLEATATTYLNLPPCGGTAKVCRSAPAVAAIVPAIRSGRVARNNLEAAVTSSSGAPVPASLYTALTAQTSTLQAIIVQYRISQ